MVLHSTLSSLILFTTFLTSVFADTSDSNFVDSIDACNWDNLGSSRGIAGTVYTYTEDNTLSITDANFYQSNFRTGQIIGTVEDMTTFSFSLDGSYTTFSGVPLDSNRFVLESTGYFYRMLSMLFLFHFIMNGY